MKDRLTLANILTDIRAKIPRANWSNGFMEYDPLMIVLHYNGPLVPGAGNPARELAQMIADARWHMRPNAFGPGAAGDGLQYHGFTDCKGSSLMCRDIAPLAKVTAKLWHSGSAIGNDYGLAWHIPIGGKQVPTPDQLNGLWIALDAMRLQWSIPRSSVLAHKELNPSTLCPGDPLMAALKAYRALDTDQVQIYKALGNARVRVLPDVTKPVANGGKAVLIKGSTFAAIGVLRGASYQGDPQWVRRADGLGYVHSSLVERVK